MKLFAAFIFVILAFQSMAQAQDCRARIPSRVSDNGHFPADPRHAQLFVDAYDLMTPPLRAFMCKFSNFDLVDLDSTANSAMEFRLGLAAQNVSADRWATWKEQLNFGVPNNDSFLNNNSLPHVQIRLNNQMPGFLYFVLVHEMGHNLPRNGAFESQWRTLHFAPANKAVFNYNLCSYWCQGSGKPVTPPAAIPGLYNAVYGQSNIPTIYAARNEEEDFADSFAGFVLLMSGGDYETISVDGTHYSLKGLYNSPQFAAKLAMLKQAYGALGFLAPRRPEYVFEN